MGILDSLRDIYKDTCIKVYNPFSSTPKLVGVYKDFNNAGCKLGIVPTMVHKKCVNKRLVFSPNLKLDVAVRLKKLTPEDIILIEKTRKNLPL